MKRICLFLVLVSASGCGSSLVLGGASLAQRYLPNPALAAREKRREAERIEEARLANASYLQSTRDPGPTHRDQVAADMARESQEYQAKVAAERTLRTAARKQAHEDGIAAEAAQKLALEQAQDRETIKNAKFGKLCRETDSDVKCLAAAELNNMIDNACGLRSRIAEGRAGVKQQWADGKRFGVIDLSEVAQSKDMVLTDEDSLREQIQEIKQTRGKAFSSKECVGRMGEGM